MTLLTRTRWLGKTIKSANRFSHIVGVFAKHGFQNILEDLQLGKFISKFNKSNIESKYSFSERLRMSLEELGPTFIKFGQVMASRPDLLPDDLITELKKLHDQVPALPYETVIKAIEEEYKKPWDQIFLKVEETPLGAASIAQVHRAILNDGKKVVIKVQRPGILPIIKEDLDILYTLALLLEKYLPESRVFSPSDMVEEFANSIELETDFIIEANNILRFQKNFEDDPHVVIPEVYMEYTTSKIIVLEELIGKRLSEADAFEQTDVDKYFVVETGVKAFFKMVFEHGIFHGDLHAGNFFILPNHQIGFVDFGMVGYLSQKTRDSIASILTALATEDYEQLAFEFLELAPQSYDIDITSFTHDLQALFAPYYGLSFKNFTVGKMLLDATSLASKHGIRMPSELLLLFKSIITMEGMGRLIGEDFDLLSFSGDFAAQVIKAKFGPKRIAKNMSLLAKDSSALIYSLPLQTRQLLKKFNNPNFHWKHDIKQIHDLRKSMEKSSKIIFLGMIIGSLILSGTIGMFIKHSATVYSIPIVSFVSYTLAGVTGLVAFYNYISSK